MALAESSGGQETGEKSVEEVIEELKSALEEERKRSNTHLTRLKYLQADFENYRKRVKREVEEAVKLEVKRLILKFLHVMDNLESAVKIGKETDDKEALIKGVEMVLKAFKEALEEEGITSIEALGKQFNPKLHEAVEVVQADSPDSLIVEELRKGYLLRGELIRPSLVKVAKSSL